jgi:hypothetical protein
MLVRLVAMVFIAYKVSAREWLTARGIVVFALTAGGAMAAIDGFMLGVREEGRACYGRVTSGVVVEMFSSTGAGGSRRIGRSGGRNQAITRPVVTANGFAFYQSLARMIVTGSPDAWVVDYRFPCAAATGTCFGRDFVTEEQWWRLDSAVPVNVRQADWETATSRLDDNPQWATAFVYLGIGAVLLALARLVANWKAIFRRQWLTAPAVVTAVEPLSYGNETRWRVRFAYFDREGLPQESVDQVATNTWKSGDDCVAVYRVNQPDIATLQPAD